MGQIGDLLTINKKLHDSYCYLHEGALPSDWCTGCGMGTMVNVFIQAVKKMNLSTRDMCILRTGIGCTDKVIEYFNIPFQEITKESIIDHVFRLKKENPVVKIVIFIDDTDFLIYGAELFMQIGAAGMDLVIIYFNNYIYRIFIEHRLPEKRPFQETIEGERSQSPFNIPGLAKYCGANYIARWTSHLPRRLMDSYIRALEQSGLSVIEVISPCLMYFPNIGMIGEKIDRMQLFYNDAVIRHDESTGNLDLRIQKKIIVGEFG